MYSNSIDHTYSTYKIQSWNRLLYLMFYSFGAKMEKKTYLFTYKVYYRIVNKFCDRTNSTLLVSLAKKRGIAWHWEFFAWKFFEKIFFPLRDAKNTIWSVGYNKRLSAFCCIFQDVQCLILVWNFFLNKTKMRDCGIKPLCTHCMSAALRCDKFSEACSSSSTL